MQGFTYTDEPLSMAPFTTDDGPLVTTMIDHAVADSQADHAPLAPASVPAAPVAPPPRPAAPPRPAPARPVTPAPAYGIAPPPRSSALASRPAYAPAAPGPAPQPSPAAAEPPDLLGLLGLRLTAPDAGPAPDRPGMVTPIAPTPTAPPHKTPGMSVAGVVTFIAVMVVVWVLRAFYGVA